MNLDFRLKVSFLDNVKIVKLQNRYGPEAVLSIIRLWGYMAVNKPSGVMDGMDAEDIAIASRWVNTNCMLTACVELKLIENIDGVYCIHGWEEHNPWAAAAGKRSEQARNAAKSRWSKDLKKQPLNADSMQPACTQHADSNAPILTLPILTLPKYKPDFEKVWKRYPNTDGKKASKAAFEKTVLTEDDFNTINNALDCYLVSKKVKDGYIKNASTWFRNWQDWIGWKEPTEKDYTDNPIFHGK